MISIIVRDYKLSDATDLVNIFYNTIHIINAKDYTSEQIEVWAPKKILSVEGWVTKWSKNPPLVATIGESVVGFVEVIEKSQSYHIDCFYVHHQFQSKGVAKALMMAVFKVIDQKKKDYIDAEVSITARPFFEKMGFVVIKEQEVCREKVMLKNFYMKKSMKRYILTGTPGCGKTSVLKALHEEGAFTIEEAATDIIQKEQLAGNHSPWLYPSFIDKIVELQYERSLEEKGPLSFCFYDRSPFCTYALSQYLQFPPSARLMEEINRCLEQKVYQKKVFFLDNLGTIEKSAARTISYEEALIFEKIHKDVYLSFGFELCFVPRASVKERGRFILNHL